MLSKSNCKHFPDADDHCLVCEREDTLAAKYATPEPDFELECIRCSDVVHSDTMDEDGRCGDCQERSHQAQEMYR